MKSNTLKRGMHSFLLPHNLLLVMKLTIFMLTIALAQVSAKGFGQKITLNEKRTAIQKVLHIIEKQSGYTFFYDSKDLPQTPITVQVKDVSVEDAVKASLNDLPLSYKFVKNNIVLSRKETIQLNLPQTASSIKLSISGKVVDSIGMQLNGATVINKNSGLKTGTNSKGEFTITAEEGDKIQVAFIGYELYQFLATAKEPSVTIVLKQNPSKLNEVVVVGYGTSKKKDLTGSVVSVDLKAFKESPNMNVLERLKGSVPGLNISQTTGAGSDPAISIRGINTISGTSTPLVVLDGIIFRGTINEINPNDIESISVLKDASATAIYGSQAANGVIIITTKIGDTTTDKPVISFSSSYALQSPTKVLKPLDLAQFTQKIYDADWQNAYLGPDYTQLNPNYINNHFLTSTSKDNFLAGVNNDWWDLTTLKHPSIADLNLGIRGKSKNTSYFLSIGYSDQKNLIIGDKYNRTTARINIENKVTNWLTIGVRSYLGYNNYSGASPNLRQLYLLPPYERPYDSSGEIILAPHWGFELSPLLNKSMPDNEKQIDLNGTFSADVKIPWISGLSYRFNGGITGNMYHHYFFNQWGAQFVGTGYKSYNNQTNWTADNILTYNHNFNNVHNVNVTLLYGQESRFADGTSASATGFSNTTLGYNSLQAGNAAQGAVSSSAWKENSLYSMARLFYSFKNKYMFTGTIRRDGFSGFGANNKFGVFPSLALAWSVTDEHFASNLTWLNNFKLRVSYGVNGNRTVGRYQTLAPVVSQTAYLYGSSGSPVQGQYVNGIGNPDLKWERTTGLNFGADFSILNSRISGTLDYYNTNTKDLLYTVNIPVVNGFSTVSSNIGELRNKGFELILTGNPIKEKDFNWNITTNFSLNRDKIISLINKNDNIVSNSLFINQPLNVWYDYKVVGMWQIADERNGNIINGFKAGQWKLEDLDKNGQINAQDRSIQGYLSPSYRFGIKNELSYKNLKLMVFINSIQGGRKYYYGNISPQDGNWVGGGDNVYISNMPKWDWWTPSNPNAIYPRLDPPAGIVPVLNMQRNFIRVQNVTLSYNFSNALLTKANIRNLNVYISGLNLLTFTKWRGWDPEAGIGYQSNAMPVMKSYSLGLNVEF